MLVKYWGVRGSMPSPGKATARYGGNTSCVSIEVGDKLVVLGAGTGIRMLGKSIQSSDREIVLILSHLHYDHVLGFPLFAPLFETGRIIHLVPVLTPRGPWNLLQLMDGTHWPVTTPELTADIRLLDDPTELLADAGVRFSSIRVNHPGGSLGFKFVEDSQVFVHVPDNELEPPDAPVLPFEDMAAFCRGATVLSHDAQYLDPEMPHREGWGHSIAMTTCRLAIAAAVRHLVLFHHDPDRSDDDLDRIGRMAQTELSPHGITSTVAYEGLELDLSNPETISGPQTGHSLID